jgi:hypothetical protein
MSWSSLWPICDVLHNLSSCIVLMRSGSLLQ